MRVRSVVLPVAVAVATAVAVPSPAQAATQCGLIVPTKVVINAVTVDTDITLTSGVFTNEADHAYWDYSHSSGYSGALDFESTDLADGDPNYYITWDDDQPMGNYALTPVECKTADGVDLTQNSGLTKAKYASKIAATVTRTSTKLSWAATATQWSGRAHTNVARPGVTVGLFYQATGSTTWSYVKSATTSSTGKVAIAVSSPKSGNYRLV